MNYSATQWSVNCHQPDLAAIELTAGHAELTETSLNYQQSTINSLVTGHLSLLVQCFSFQRLSWRMKMGSHLNSESLRERGI
jgi:hypothetical protein